MKESTVHRIFMLTKQEGRFRMCLFGVYQHTLCHKGEHNSDTQKNHAVTYNLKYKIICKKPSLRDRAGLVLYSAKQPMHRDLMVFKHNEFNDQQMEYRNHITESRINRGVSKHITEYRYAYKVYGNLF